MGVCIQVKFDVSESLRQDVILVPVRGFRAALLGDSEVDAKLSGTTSLLEDAIKPDTSSSAAKTRHMRHTWPGLPARLTSVLWWLAMTVYFVFALIILTLRYAILPHVEDYRSDIERALSSSLNLPVAIASIDAHWQGLLPNLALHGMQIHDRQGRPALAFDNVEAELSWTSLLYFDLRLHRLEIFAPALTIRRDAQGRIFIAGLQLNTQTPNGQNDFSDWLLAQHRVIVRDASINWLDEMRAAPPLALQHLNFHLENDGSRHRFGFTAEPPHELAARLDIRGDFKGDDLDELEAWKGETYAELDYADLAVWRKWVDYPIELPQGSGALRLWLGFAHKALTSVTADIALHNVQVRLARDLPLLDLQNLTGRLGGRRLAHGFEASGKRLSLLTRDDIKVEPSDFQLLWNEADGRSPATGAFSANGLDLDALSRLAAYLPFEAATRQQLADFAPRGKLFDLKTNWSASVDANGQLVPTKYSINARFERLGVNARGALPGFVGLTGSVTGDEQAGVFRLASRDAGLELPSVFAEPRIGFGALNAQAGWKSRKEAIEVNLENAAFENHDAAGVISGKYVYPKGETSTPGEIDLNARLTRGDGGAVWRYIPLAVGKDVREWLRASIVGGGSNETTLRLKGDLRRFPFADGSGVFEVKGRIQGASLRYAPSWPQIDNISGSLEFVGNRMLIKGDSANIFGVALSEVRAEIADLAAHDNQLLITGKAAGPTADFLRFIEASAVGEQIGHFTEDMTAQGNGFLDLKLLLPLRHLVDAKIEGTYQFAGNKLKVDADLPPLGEVYGRLQFTGDALKAERVRATLLGMPLTFDLRTAGNGAVTVNADGNLNIAEMRKQISHPLLDQLSGSSPWRGTIQARKKSAEVVVESKLLGLSSSLPEPFNKSASEAMPLRFERKLLVNKPAAAGAGGKNSGATAAKSAVAVVSSAAQAPAPQRDQIDATFGTAVAVRLIRRYEGERGDKPVLERGAIAVGESLVLPDKGVLLAVNMKKVDADLWRGLLSNGGTDRPAAGEPAAPQAFPLTAITLKTPELIVFGSKLSDLDVRASLGREGGWRADMKSRDATGELTWKGQGSGRLSGHLKQLVINQAPSPQSGKEGESAGTPASSTRAASPDELPGLDIEVDQFQMRGKAFGKLKLAADNRDGTWEARLDIENDDGKLSGTGKWRPHTAQPDTQLKFTLTARSIEKMLARMGYVDAVRRGKATLEGDLSWNGAPFAIDYPTLSGALKVDAENGQFNKLEPGGGRLLGILSLQSLPRRITLDFRDVFSQGFAFDSISGQLKMHNGVIATENLQIKGPSAKVLMSGSVNVPQETQNLKVRVQPAIGESIAVGAMIANPAAGAIAWLAQKVLSDPLDQAFAFEYAVTGGWADPKVEKISSPQRKPEGFEKNK